MIDEAEARRTDGQILEIARRRRWRSVILARLFWDMSAQAGYRALGYDTFDAYLAARRIPRGWAYFLKGVYQRLAVELEIDEWDWVDIPLSRLQGLLRILTPLTVRELLADARVMPRDMFRAHLRYLRGQGETWLRGTYRLEPADRPESIEKGSRRSLRARVYQSHDGNWYADFPG